MGVVIRQSIKASIVSYFGALIGAITVIVVFPYFLKPDQIGLIRVITEAALLFSLFSMFGANNAFVKFYPENFNKNLAKFLGFIIVVSISGFVFSLLVYWYFSENIVAFYAEKSSLVNSYFIFVLPLSLIFIGIALLEVYSAQMLRIVYPKIIREIIIRVLTIMLVIAFSVYSLSLTGFVSMFVAIYVVAFIALLFYVKKITLWQPDFYLASFFRGNSKPYLRYMLTMFVFNVSIAIATRADLFIITSMLSLADTGIYSIAFFIAAFIEIPTRSVLQIVTPLVSKALNENNIEQLEEYYKKVSINQLLISSIIFIVLWINIDALYSLMPNGKIYEAGKYVILFIGLCKIVDAVTSINAIILSYSKYYTYSIVFVVLLAVVTVINNLLFIPVWGITGAAFATFLSLVVYHFGMILFVWYKFRIQPFALKTLLALAIIFVCIVAATFLPEFGNIITASILKSVICTGLFLFLALKFKLSPDFNAIAKQILKMRSLNDAFRFLMPK